MAISIIVPFFSFFVETTPKVVLKAGGSPGCWDSPEDTEDTLSLVGGTERCESWRIWD